MAHEVTATEWDAESGWWINFPTVWNGKELPRNEAFALAKKTGRIFGYFKTLDLAESGAMARSANTPERERAGLFQRLLNSMRSRGDLVESDLRGRLQETAQARQTLFDQDIAIPGQHLLTTMLPDETTGFKGRMDDPLVAMGLDPRVMVPTDKVISTGSREIIGAFFSSNKPLFKDKHWPLYQELLGKRGKELVEQGRGPMLFTDTGPLAHEARHRGLNFLKEVEPEARMSMAEEEALVYSMSEDPQEVLDGLRFFGNPNFDLRDRLIKRARGLLSR